MAGDLSDRPRVVRLTDVHRSTDRATDRSATATLNTSLNTTLHPAPPVLDRAPPEALFVVSAISQYVGASIAVTLFDRVDPQTVTWFRLLGASLALLAVSRGFRRGWTPRQLAAAAVFGVATSLMNLFFYMAVAEIDLGKSVAIEFIGPIVVAAATTRSGRNAVALAVATLGVAVLGGVELGEHTRELLFILAASAMWAVYIVVGSRVARLDRGVAGLGVGLGIGATLLAPIGLPGSGPVWTTPTLLVLALATGVFSNAIGYGIDQHVLRRIPIRRFSVMLALLPVTAAVIGWVVLGQRPDRLDTFGIACILLAVLVQDRERLPLAEPILEPTAEAAADPAQ